MRRSWVSEAALWWMCSAGLLGCSALIKVDDTQCNNAEHCIAAKLGNACVQHVCVGDVSDISAASDGHCTRDNECAASVPRCMRGTCVAQDVADRFLCDDSADDSSAGDTVQYKFHVLEFISRKPPNNVRAKACRSNDVTCSSPVASFTDKDQSGDVTLELPKNFLGFIEVKSDALTALSYLTKPLKHDTTDRDLQVSAASTVTLLAQVDGTIFDTTRGLAIVEAFDCAGMPAGGVHFSESKGDSHPFYIVNNQPNSDVQASVYDSNNDIAAGGFINVQPGFVTFSARAGVDGPLLGEFNASVRANAITFVYMYF